MATGLGLGRVFDISAGVVVSDFAAGASTGNRVSMKNCSAITVLVTKKVFTDTQPAVLTLKQHTASSSGTSSNLAIIDTVYKKVEATLDGDETWTKVTQAAAATFTEASTDDTLQAIYAFTVRADQLSDGYSYISVDVADTGATTGDWGTVLYILHDLNVRRAPENLVAPLS